MNNRVNGFPVIVLDGREITQKQFAELDADTQNRCVRRLNGPHYNAKWAKDRRDVADSKWHKREFFGSTVKRGKLPKLEDIFDKDTH